MELRNSTDAELLEAFVSGHEASFAVFMQRHLLPLQRWLRITLSEDADVDDVVQETFQAVVNQAHTFQGENARAWLFGIGRRKAYRLFRRRSGEPEHFVELDELALKAGWGNPESALHEAQDREFLKKMLRRLDAEAREVLILRDVEEFSTGETAQILGATIPAVKSRLHRARLELMAEIRRAKEAGHGT